MATIELERTINQELDGNNDDTDEHRIVHLYQTWHDTAACGVSLANDWHRGAHGAAVAWKEGMTSCPVCDAPICMDCLLEAGG